MSMLTPEHLRPYQRLAIEHMIDRPRGATWASMGMGKTVSTLTAFDALRLAGEANNLLVIAPKRVARSTWPKELGGWTHLRDLGEATPILGTPAQRREALRADRGCVYTINYENVPWLVEQCGRRWPFDMVIPDESTRLKGFRLRGGTQRARALARIARNLTHRWQNLTGTPGPNGYLDLWGQQFFVDFGEALGRTFTAYKERFFEPDNPFSDYPRMVLRPFADQMIHDRLADSCLTLRAQDWFDLEKPIVTDVKVDLPSKARQLYDQFEREMFAELDGHDIEAMNAASRTTKAAQIASGACYVDADGNFSDEPQRRWKEVHTALLDALESVVTEAAGAPVLVAYQWKHDLERLQRAFPKGRVLDDDPQTIDDWNAGRIPLLFAHPASAGHGLNLQDGGNILAFFGLWWDLELYQQVLERIGPVRQLQAGHDRPVFIYHIVARGTVHELMAARRKGKEIEQDGLLAAMRREA